MRLVTRYALAANVTDIGIASLIEQPHREASLYRFGLPPQTSESIESLYGGGECCKCNDTGQFRC
jgi:hypothetical protein